MVTNEQQDKLTEYRDKWLNIGLCTKPADRKTAESGINIMYESARHKPPKIIWGRSPAEIFSMYHAELTNLISLRRIIRDNVESKAWVIASKIESEVRQLAMDLMLDGGQRTALIRIGEHICSTISGITNGILDTAIVSPQHDTFWLGFYEYFNDICQLNMSDLRGQWMVAKSAGWYIPCEDFCWISERPAILNVNNRWQLHCDNGKALHFPCEQSLVIDAPVYALNGIKMKPEYVLTPADKLSPETILQEENVDVRRELLRKIGVLRMISHGKEIETWGEYKLVDMSPIFRGIEYAPFLLMKNPSLDDTWHLEGVEPECTTIEEALHRHKPEAMRRIPVDDKLGEAWYQQGDVMIWPDSAIVLRRYLVVLT